MVPAIPFGGQNQSSSLTNVATKHSQASPSIIFNSSPPPRPLKAQITQQCVFLQTADLTALGPFLGQKKKHTKPTAYLLQSSAQPKSNSLDKTPHLHSADITGSWSKMLSHVLINKASNGLGTDYLRNRLSSTILSNSCCQLQQYT